MKRRVLWLFFLIVILYVIFFITYNFFISKMSLENGLEISSYLKDAMVMQVTIGSLVSVVILIVGAFLIDLIVSRNPNA
jgi:hypothetical protein